MVLLDDRPRTSRPGHAGDGLRRCRPGHRPTSLLLTRREFDRRLRTEDRLERIVQTAEQAGDLITILETGGRIGYANQAVETATGFARRDVVGRTSDPRLPWHGSQDLLREMRHGDMALPRAKARDRNTIQFFSSAIGERMSDFTFPENRLFKALRNDEYLVHYQHY